MSILQEWEKLKESGLPCDYRWSIFKIFFLEMREGYREFYVLKRIDEKLEYSRRNCEWADITSGEKRSIRFKNAVSRLDKGVSRYEMDGEKKTIREWSLISGIEVITLRNRIVRGWSVKRAIKEPVHSEKRNNYGSNTSQHITKDDSRQ